MNCKFTNVLFFAAGAAIGSAVTWKIVSSKYEKLIQEEIDSVKEAFAGNEIDIPQEKTDSTEDEEEPRSQRNRINWSELEDLDDDEYEYEPNEADVEEYEQLTSNYSTEKGGAENMAKEPYVIAPYDFDEIDGYHTVELTYYADDILEDDSHTIITDRDELIGPKALYTFGEYEDDAVFVRNEYLQTDFQILKDYRTYEEAKNVKPQSGG